MVRSCAGLVECCYVDRGTQSPGDMLTGPHIKNIIGTETGGADLSRYQGGYMSVDVKDGKVIPSGDSPVAVLRAARKWNFEGCILLNLGFVGTENGLGSGTGTLETWRSAYNGRLFYGGGVASVADLETIKDAGFDGAIIATALHKGAVPPNGYGGETVVSHARRYRRHREEHVSLALKEQISDLDPVFTGNPGQHG